MGDPPFQAHGLEHARRAADHAHGTARREGGGEVSPLSGGRRRPPRRGERGNDRAAGSVSQHRRRRGRIAPQGGRPRRARLVHATAHRRRHDDLEERKLPAGGGPLAGGAGEDPSPRPGGRVPVRSPSDHRSGGRAVSRENRHGDCLPRRRHRHAHPAAAPRGSRPLPTDAAGGLLAGGARHQAVGRDPPDSRAS